MLKTVSKIFTFMVVVIYVITTMGVSIHSCNKTGASNVEILYVEDTCDCSHDNNCCSTTVVVLEEDQFVNSNEYQVNLPVEDISLYTCCNSIETNFVAGVSYSNGINLKDYNLILWGDSIIISNKTLRV